MEHAVEIDNIKKDLRITQDSVLLIHQDLKQMSKGISEMASSMKIMVEVQSDMRLMNERIESRHMAQKDINKLTQDGLDNINTRISTKCSIVESQARDGRTAYNILKWIGITFGTLVCGSVFVTWLYVVALQGVK
jgi:hypothetical protein